MSYEVIKHLKDKVDASMLFDMFEQQQKNWLAFKLQGVSYHS